MRVMIGACCLACALSAAPPLAAAASIAPSLAPSCRFAPLPPPRRASASALRLCAVEETSGDAAGAPPPPRAPRARLEPIDQAQVDLERADFGPRASPAELAAHLPRWAQELMLDPDANEEYEEEQARARAAALRERRVKGRTWDGEDLVHDATAHGGWGDAAGLAHFTAEELADDYRLPLETVCAQLLELGVAPDRLGLRAPVKSFCTQQQLGALLEILGSADPIAARESFVEQTLSELVEEGRVADGLGPEQLLALCRSHDIPAALGVETRVRVEDYAKLLDVAEREAAFLGEQPGEGAGAE